MKFKNIIEMFKNYHTGAIIDNKDDRDYSYDSLALGASPIDWNKGYDVEKELNITLPKKNQGKPESCVGQAVSYYVGVLNAVETGKYDEASAKSIYSQIFLPNGGAYIRKGIKLIVDYGCQFESNLSSYIDGKLPTEKFIRDLGWKNPINDKLAKTLQAKSYATIQAKSNMDLYAMAIRDNHGVVGGVYGDNRSGWSTNEPKHPKKLDWGHCLYFGKFGTDELGKYIATPNSWGNRKTDKLHPDGWQKLREDYFQSAYQFNPWTLIDKPNTKSMKLEDKKLYKLIEGNAGKIGFKLDDKLLINETEADKLNVLIEFVSRGGKFNSSNIQSVGLKDWNSVKHINLKKLII